MNYQQGEIIRLKPDAEVNLSFKTGNPPLKAIQNALWHIDDVIDIEPGEQNLAISLWEGYENANPGEYGSFVSSNDVKEKVYESGPGSRRATRIVRREKRAQAGSLEAALRNLERAGFANHMDSKDKDTVAKNSLLLAAGLQALIWDGYILPETSVSQAVRAMRHSPLFGRKP